MTKTCILCKMTVDDRVKMGEFMKSKGITVHYYCLLLTSNLVQNGASDSNGILGFMPKDIQEEERRIRQQVCYYCAKPNANLSCCASKCYRNFHLYCGLMNSAVCHFTGDFKTLCSRHYATERKKCSRNDNCVICCDSMGPYRKVYSMLAPCCRSGWFHKWCLAEFALNAGYFFKCPLCNNKETFRSKLVHKGIFVPDQDATWELEPNAFADLLERPDSCSAVECKCSKGRTYNKHPHRLLTCNTCGSKCIHTSCMAKTAKTYTCDECSNLLSDIKPNATQLTALREIVTPHNVEEEEIVVVDDVNNKKQLFGGNNDVIEVLSDDESEDSIVVVLRERGNTRNIRNKDSPSSSCCLISPHRSNSNSTSVDSSNCVRIENNTSDVETPDCIIAEKRKLRKLSSLYDKTSPIPKSKRSSSLSSEGIIIEKTNRKLINRGSHSLDTYTVDDVSSSTLESRLNGDRATKLTVNNHDENYSLDLFSESESISTDCSSPRRNNLRNNRPQSLMLSSCENSPSSLSSLISPPHQSDNNSTVVDNSNCVMNEDNSTDDETNDCIIVKKRKLRVLSSSDDQPSPIPKSKRSSSTSTDCITKTNRKLTNRDSNSLDKYTVDDVSNSTIEIEFNLKAARSTKPTLDNRAENHSLDLFSESEMISQNFSTPRRPVARIARLKDEPSSCNSIGRRLRNRARSLYVDTNENKYPEVRRSLRLRSKSIEKSVHDNIISYNNKLCRYVEKDVVETTPSWDNSVNLALQRNLLAYLSHSKNYKVFKDSVPDESSSLNESVSSIGMWA